MAEPSVLTRCIELYVDTSCSPSEQAKSLDSIASLVNKGLLTIEMLVKELEMYLTTTDNVIRARGTLLLAELLTSLSKPLNSATIHSLIGFFTDRLADWRALRGALVGCLALLKRKSNVGMVFPSDAKKVAESYLKNLQIQSLGQHDRKLCFELLECLLERYPHEVSSMDEELIYGISESFDGEKDPHCLMLVFHIVSSLVQLFPNPSGSLANFYGDLFEIFGCYFPIHFTHQKVEESGVTREDLSRALMIAFSSTPLFEPYVIPLLLEKLSSSLQSAKVDSLKYLSYCSVKYGASRMEKHIGAIWSLLKSVISDSLIKDNDTNFYESIHGLGFRENEIGLEALALLETIVKQNYDSVISLIVDDEDISTIFNTITSYGSYKELSSEGKQRLCVISRILSITSKTSVAPCYKVLETFFPSLVNILLQPMIDSPKIVINFGALYLSTELLALFQDLITGSGEHASNSVLASEAFCCVIRSLCTPLINTLCSTLAMTSSQVHDVDIYFRVQSLKILATFPEEILPMSNDIFEHILSTLVSIVIIDSDNFFLWKAALDALVQMGSFVSRCISSEKALSYTTIVVEKITSLMSVDSGSLPISLKLEAMAEIGASGRNHMLKIVQGLEGAIFAKMSDIYVHGNTHIAATAIQLLQCFSDKVIPWICENEGLEENLLHFSISIWDHVESWISDNVQVQEKGLLDSIVILMKHTVGSCSVEYQNTILQKAYSVLSSSIPLPLNIPSQFNGSLLCHNMGSISIRDGLVLSLFASVIIAAKPKANIRNVREISHLFLTALLGGHVSSAQALGSMINKFDTKSEGTIVSGKPILEEVINIIFLEKIWCSRGALKSDDTKKSLIDLCLGFVDDDRLQISAIVGLAWVGKGLLLRGHEKVKDVIMILMDCLLPSDSFHSSNTKQCSLENICDRVLNPSVTKATADAFHLLMSDSDSCLNRRFHAIIRPLYKQRLFSVVMPILLSSIKKSDSDLSRYMLYRASAHIISDAPLILVLNEAKKVILILLEGLSIFKEDNVDKENLYNLLLVLSGLLTNDKGREAVIENAHSVISCLSGLVHYPHMKLVRETAIQCLVAMSELPHSRIYPMRSKVLGSVSKALDDPKRAVRQEAIKCRRAWASTTS